METNIFNELSQAVVRALTHFINAFSGLLQITIYLAIGLFFFYALFKCIQALRLLTRYNFAPLDAVGLATWDQAIEGTPLAMVAAAVFTKTKRHYLQEEKTAPQKVIPPDGFIRDAAYQYSDRYFSERYLDPISLTANLMPSLGFIGTIIGMVVHFLSNTGSLNSHPTVVGIATALYTTFVGLVCYTILEFMVKWLETLCRRRIDEGLAAAAALPSMERGGHFEDASA